MRASMNVFSRASIVDCTVRLSGRVSGMTWRLAVLVLGGLMAVMAEDAVKKPAPTVVFVCEHGAAKSVLASQYFEQLAKERGLKIRAISRGTNPDKEVGPAVRKGLLE